MTNLVHDGELSTSAETPSSLLPVVSPIAVFSTCGNLFSSLWCLTLELGKIPGFPQGSRDAGLPLLLKASPPPSTSGPSSLGIKPWHPWIS